MKNEDIEHELEMLKYFYFEKGDMTRYVSYDKALKVLEQHSPAISFIIKNYVEAQRALEDAFKRF